MTAIKLDDTYKYSIHPNIYGILKGLAVDSARIKVEVAGVADLTDNSTGTAATAFVNVVIPTVAYDATSTGGAQRSGLNTALGVVANVGKVLVNSFNNVRARLGLPLMSAASGTQASADTIPAMTKTVTSTSGTSAVDFATGVVSLAAAKSNFEILVRGFNEIRRAIGEPDISMSPVLGSFSGHALAAIPSASAAATGASSISATVADAFLLALANNVATIAQYWNYMMIQAGPSDLTDSTTGVAAGGLAANVLPTAADGAATTSSPKAGFDAQLVVIKNALASLCSRMNAIRVEYDLTPYTDSTGGAVTTTLAALSKNLTAVDGSSGSSAVEEASALARLAAIDNALSSLGVGINQIVDFFGVPALTTDLLGGTPSTTLAVIAATATGTSGVGATLLDADVDGWLSINADNIATLAAKLNALTGTTVPVKPLSIVAG